MTLEEIDAPRAAGEVTIHVTIDGGEPTPFTADTTTTGNPYIAVRRLLIAVERDTWAWFNDGRDEAAASAAARRRATVAASVLVAGDRHRVDLDTTTTGSPYVAAKELVGAAVVELREWLISRPSGRLVSLSAEKPS